MQTFDAVIVGAGFAGAATAFHLVRQGVRRIALVEREAVPGYHASGRNAALAFTAIQNPEIAQLARTGLRFICGEASELAGHEIFRPCGSLLVVTQETTANRLHQIATVGASAGSSWLNSDDLRHMVPALRLAPLQGGLWTPTDGVVDIHALLQLYLQNATHAGARVYYNTAIVGVPRSKGKVVAVESTAGTWNCGVLINAAGAWATQVGHLAGSPLPAFEPRRRHLFLGRPPLPVDRNWPFVWHADVDTYFRPEGDGLLLSPCDATPHPALEPMVDEEAKTLLARKILAAFPALANTAILTGWACLRTFAPDEQFVIGPDPDIDGFFWVAALGGHGMTTSWAVGRLAAAVVLGNHLPELAAFHPQRLLPSTAAAGTHH